MLLAVCMVRCAAAAAPAAEGRDTPAAEPQRWSVLPALGYTTETSVFVGGMAVHYLPEAPGTRGSSLPVIAMASVKGQYQAFFVPDLYSAGNVWHLEAAVTVSKWPANYYPRGNDSPHNALQYESNGVETEALLERRLTEGAYLGPMVRFVRADITWDRDRAAVRGAGGGRLVGVGFSTSYDTRDNVNEARSGSYASAGAALYRSGLGSDHDFETVLVRMRRYVGLGGRGSLALAGDLQLLGGRPPFSEWSSADGFSLLRGIENGRYRDTHLLSLQAEYRRRLGGPWGAVAFADAAQVAARVADFSPGDLRFALGGGLRYALNPRQRFNLRLDAAWVDGTMGFVFSAGEAF